MAATNYFPNPPRKTHHWGLLVLAMIAWSGLLRGEDVELTWSDNSDNEDGFNIERSVGDGSFELLAQVASNIESYTDSTAEPGVDYSYRVNAYNSFGSSGYTNVAAHYINVAPTISEIGAVEVEENESADGIQFSISDFEANAGALDVSVSTSNTDLIDVDGLALGGSGANRTLTLTPNLNASGDATITLTVSDGEDSTSTDFLFSVSTFVLPTLQLAIDTVGAQPRAGEDFSLSSTASDTSVVSAVAYYLDGELLGEVSSTPYAFSFAVPEVGAYELSAVARISGRDETVSSETQIVVGAAPSSSNLVANLKTLSVDNESGTGTASYDLSTDEFYIENEMGLIAGVSDSHRYYYLRAEGDVSISANLSELEVASSQSVAGLMLRSALYGKSEQASLLRNASGGLEVRTRDSRGGSTEVLDDFEGESGEAWLRIDKSGSSIKYYSRPSSSDQWDLLHEESLDLGTAVFLGFAVAGGDEEGMASASFTQARLQGDILSLGDDAVKPEIPSGLFISGITK